MKYIKMTAIVFLGVAAFAQDVQFDYNRSANFNAYKTYQWVDYKPVQVGDELLDQDIKRAVDEQLAGKSLRRVESGGDLLVGYQAGISQEKQFDSFGSGGRGGPFPWGLGNWGNTLDRWYHRAAVVVWPRQQAFANRAETSPAWALDELAATASAGSRNREIEATRRASPARSTDSARPKLWITLAAGTPVCGLRALCANCR